MGSAGRDYEFGRFRLEAARRLLLADGVPVPLSSRAFDILLLLVELRDRVVTKDEILERVWHGTIVEENNLSVQVSGLRRALGEKSEGQPFIITIPGRGYRFVGQVADGAPTMAAHLAGTSPAAGEAAVSPVAQSANRPAIDSPANDLPDDDRPIWRRRPGAIAAAASVAAIAVILAVMIVRGISAPNESGSSGESATNAPAATPAPRLSIVVLPFRNLSNDPEQDYLADAVSDDLTTELSHLVGSFVIARQSSDIYKGRPINANAIGRELGVRYMLEGSVRRVDDKILINAQLIDTETGAHLWADRFDTPRAKLAEAQSNIVQHIGSALNFRLVQIEGQRSVHDRPNDPDALDLFLRARSILDRDNTIKDLEDAQHMLEKAIELQPGLVDGMSELALLLLTKVRDFDIATDAEDLTEARKLIAKALEIAPDDARTLSAKGMLLMMDQGCQEAVASYRLALSFDPHSIPALTGLARCADELGHPDETAQLIQQILRLDPQNPKNRIRFHQLGMAFAMAGRPADAISWLQQAEAGDPEPSWSNEMALLAAYALTGKTQEAKAKYATYALTWPHQSVWRLGCYATRAQAALPGFKQMLEGLKSAGMPAFVDEMPDDGVAPAMEQRRAGDFEPTPLEVPGAHTVRTAALAALLKQDSALPVLDVGCGGAVVQGAYWLHRSTFTTPDAESRLQAGLATLPQAKQDKKIVVVGSGPYGWGSYNAALKLVSLGYQDVLWYRGGEESWAAAGLPAEDRR